MKSPGKGEHRTRVGAERRARMRRKLIEAALIVFAEKGVDASIIDHVIAAAGVSRGTFYNYFRSNTELLIATSEELANEIADLIEGSLDGAAPSVVSLATGLRLFLDVVRRFPAAGPVRDPCRVPGRKPDGADFRAIPRSTSRKRSNAENWLASIAPWRSMW